MRALLVFTASAAVLVLEILGFRLLAPYTGVTLETSTTIIGIVLAGIAAGSAAGGRLADLVDPRTLVPLLLVAGGVLAVAIVPLVRALGELTDAAAGEVAAFAITLVAFLPPAAVLSAVTPAMAKLELSDLTRTGSVVGRLSAFATAGALFGTFVTGFVLVPLLPTTATVYGVGALLLVVGVAVGARRHALTASVAAVVLALMGLAAGSRCDTESVYFCASVEADDERASGRTLVLDDLQHSYVDLADPTHLEFAYVRWMGALIDARRPEDAVFLGGGGFTLPRYLLATVPGSRATVLEVDGQLVDLVRERLGLRTGPDLRVRVGDGRRSMRELPAASADLVVGDAFGGLSVPWHLATVEFAADVRRVLRPDGLYLVNVIDRGPLDLARSLAATLREVFGHVAVVDDDRPGGNLVMVASAEPVRLAAVEFGAGGDPTGGTVFADGAPVLTDDDAPADQLLTTRTR